MNAGEGGPAPVTTAAHPAPAAGAPHATHEPAPSDLFFEDTLAVPLRHAHPVEKVLRLLAVALLLLSFATSTWARLSAPRYVPDTHAVLREAAAGRLVAVDRVRYRDAALTEEETRDGVFRWRTRDGTYVSPAPPYDLARGVRAQPYVAAHPGSVTFGRIGQYEPPLWTRLLFPLVYLGAIVLLFRSPQPRLLTRWGWAFTFRTGVGLVAYLLLGGSAARATGRPPGRRVNGWVVVGTATALGVAALVMSTSGVGNPLDRLRGIAHPAPAADGQGVVVPPPPRQSP